MLLLDDDRPDLRQGATGRVLGGNVRSTDSATCMTRWPAPVIWGAAWDMTRDAQVEHR
jgi:hypothetical protein